MHMHVHGLVNLNESFYNDLELDPSLSMLDHSLSLDQ